MPNTKNVLIRYKFLDELLADRHHSYTRRDLAEIVNRKLEDNYYSPVDKRTIEKDINNMQLFPFYAPIVETKKNGKYIVSYNRDSFSIFTKEMSKEEINLLNEVFATIGHFDGLDNFPWLNYFTSNMDSEESRKIISFSNNPYAKNTNLIGTLFENIFNKVVVKLSYHTFTDATIRSIDFHPYLLKQYNDRWFLIGAADSDGKILNFVLDRIDEVEPIPEKKYIECPDDLMDRFEDIIGVTLYEDRQIEHILFWVSDFSKDYVDTKPLHGSQIRQKEETEQTLREKYPQLEGGAFFTIDCISNYELIRELCSFGKDLIVLESDGDVKDKVWERIKEMYEKNSMLRT